MGWWRISDDGMITGDGPVEGVQQAIAGAPGGRAPSVRDLVDAAAAALRRGGADLLEDGARARNAVVEASAGGRALAASDAERAPAALVEALFDAWDEARVEYLDSEVARKPYAAELLAATAFAAGARDGTLLADGPALGAADLELRLR